MCLLYTPSAIKLYSNQNPAAISCLQTDDSLMLSSGLFEKMEEAKSQQFELKPTEKLSQSVKLNFNGTVISKNNNGIKLHAAVFSRATLNKIDTSLMQKDDHISQRAMGAYIAGVCRPDLVFGFGFAAQFTNPGTKEFKFLNTFIEKCIDVYATHQ